MNFFRKIAAALDRYDDEHNFTCDLCGREVFSGERVCAPCRKTLPWNDGPICPFCGRKVGEEGVCLECKQKPLATDLARSAFTHEREAQRLVLRFKGGSRYLFRTAGELLLPLLKREFSDAELITCVPMTEKAKKKRGYNQSELLARELSARSGIPFAALAEKKRDTSAQKTLGRAEREKNLAACFVVTDRAAAKGKRILVIDDTLTTGATVSELASVLKRAGAKSVCALTVTAVANRYPFGKPPENK